VDYTNTAGDIVIARYSGSPGSNVADPTSGLILLTIPHPTFANHNGGQLQFGPDDGYLYIGVGDGGSGGDPSNHGQSLDTLLGKLLRIDINGASPYAIPAGNPFIGVPGALPEIWAYGLRNPWRFSFDRSTHDLFIGDVGQDSWEEVDFQPAGSLGGQNYGWNIMEGNHCFNPPSNFNSTGLTLPILEYAHGSGDSIGCSISGGYRYRGTQNPGLTGIYFYGDFCTGRIWGASEQAGAWTTAELLDTSLSISTFGEDEAGEIYVADYAQGVIYRIVQPAPAISLTVTSLSTSCTQGSNAPSQNFQVSNSGGGTLNYTISPSQTWLSCSPPSGTSTGEQDTITVSYTTSGLAAGAYSATITITATGASNTPQTIPVSLAVNAPTPPGGGGGGGGGSCFIETAGQD
jgi:hypothetical protein